MRARHEREEKVTMVVIRTLRFWSGDHWLAFTRQGALAAARARALARTTAETTARAVAPTRPVSWLLSGSLFLGVGVAMSIRADLGLPPYDVLLSAIRDALGITHGQAGWVVGGLLLVVAIALGRRPRVNTVMFVVVTGVMIDTALPLIGSPDTMGTRVVFASLGTAAIAAGIALVVHGGGTGGPLELTIRALADRGHRAATIRTTLEFTILVSGIALGGSFGPATIVFAALIGPLVLVTEQALADHRAGRAERRADSLVAVD